MRVRIGITGIALMNLLTIAPTRACTIVMIGQDDIALAGNNEDWKNPFTSVWFVPASDEEYGRVCFGFEDPYEVALGGMNDQGLFIDGNAVASTGWEPVEGKPAFDGNVEGHVLAHCATVEEAIEFFRRNNVQLLTRGRFPVADRSGASAMIEWNRGELQVIRKTGGHQVSTNFLVSEYPDQDYPCYRYRLADKMLREAEEYGIDLVRSILAATHMEGSTPTLYSNVFDLRNGDIYIYDFHDFEQPVKLNLHEELRKGRQHYQLPTLFPFISYAHLSFVPSATISLFERHLQDGEIERVLENLPEIRRLSLACFDRDFTESTVNVLGYRLLGQERSEEAIRVFRFNVEQYSGSWNAFDSLGEAYMKNGDRSMAIENYRRSLELNPDNENAREMLGRLQDG